MRIALVHSFYRSEQPSGENVMVRAQVELLRAAGHEVHLISRDSDREQTGALRPIRTAWQVVSGGGADPVAELRAARPDVVHVHNLFPNFATKWLAQWPGPIVATVHNYRSVCANGLLFRDGADCRLCPEQGSLAAVRHRCYRGSALASVPLAVHTRGGIAGDPVLQRADRILVLSPRAREILTGYGLPGERTVLLPNGVTAPAYRRPATAGSGWVAYGRLSAEKGFVELLADWPAGEPLDIIGDGPLAQRLRHSAGPGVQILPALQRDDLLAALPRYRGVIFAGRSPEGALPLAAVEAWAVGLPLVARTGSAAEPLIRMWGGGSCYSGAVDLPDALRSAAAISPGATRELYDGHFTMERWRARLLDVYAEVLAA